MNTRGKFIVIDGGEGSGKDVHCVHLQKILPKDEVFFTREPGGTKIGEAICAVLLDSKHYGKISHSTELMLFEAARAQHVDEVIRPALSRGLHIISNRFDLATLAYQIEGRKLNDQNTLGFFSHVNSFVIGECVPDLYILLDVLPEVGLSRKKSQGEINRFELEKIEFHTRVREGFLKHVCKYPHCIIDANRSKEEVRVDLERIVFSTLGFAT